MTEIAYKTQTSFDFSSRNKNHLKLEYFYIHTITKPDKAHHYNKTLSVMSKIYKIVIKDAWTWIKF